MINNGRLGDKMVYQSEIVVNDVKQYKKEELLKLTKEELISIIFSLHSNILRQQTRIYTLNYLRKNSNMRIDGVIKRLKVIKEQKYAR